LKTSLRNNPRTITNIRLLLSVCKINGSVWRQSADVGTIALVQTPCSRDQ